MRRPYKVLLARRPEIRRLREQEGIKIRVLARKMGRSEHSLRKLLAGARIENSLAEAVAEYFGVPVSALFFEVDLEHLPEAPLPLGCPTRGDVSQTTAAA